MARDRREGRPPAGEGAEEFRLAPVGGDDPWNEAVTDKGGRATTERTRDKDEDPSSQEAPASDLPWDELADENPPHFEEASFIARRSVLIPESDDDELGPDPADEASPHGDPLDDEADVVFEPERPAARMGSLQDALASIRERVQSLSTTVQAPGARATGSSELALYRAATDDRSYAELRRHSRETEELLRRLSALMQDLSLDLRSIVDAARRAIDQTSEQAESSVELGRLLGERIEQMDKEVAARLDAVDAALSGGPAQDDTALADLQAHLDKRLTKLEQRSGVGLLREEMAELRGDFGGVRSEFAAVRSEVGAVRSDFLGVRSDLESLRTDVGTAGDTGTAELEVRLDAVSGQLDRTLAMLRDALEGTPDQDGEMVDGVADAIRVETEAAVEPLRTEVEVLSRQLTDAIERETQLSDTLATLTDEVARLRKRIAVRAAPPTVSDEQLQTIIDAVVGALPGGGAPSPARHSRRPVEPEPELEEELDVEPEPEPEPAPRPAKRRRQRPVAAAKRAPTPEPAPEYEIDINEPFAPGELEIDDSHLDVDPDAEPLRRARGTGRKSNRPLSKGRRTRSGSQ